MDDDGISNFTPLAEGDSSYFVVATATNATALAATLYAWVDFDGSGSFDADEYTSSPVAAGTNNGNIALSWSGLTDVTEGSSFARFRLTTDTLSSSDIATLANDGEVEDYALTVSAFDFGDAPETMISIDAGLGSTYGEASHKIVSGLTLGVLIDSELAGQNTGLLSDGDDTDGSNDDDGVIFPLAGGTRVLNVGEVNAVTVNASANGYLNAWIDWNQDGDWNDTGEAIATNTPLTAGSNNVILTPSAMVPQGVTYTRFRFTSASVVSPSPLGLYDDGEVEDYRVNLILPSPIDVCSSVILNTGFESAPNPTSYFIIPEEQVEGWATIPDSPASGASYGARNGIEIWKSGFQGVPAFEGSYFAELNANVPGMLYQDVQLTPGSSYTWSFAHRGRSGVDTINVMMGPPGAAVLQNSFSTGTTAWKSYGGIYTVPIGQNITRFGFQAAGSGSSGNFLDALKIPGGCDFGDAPDSYGTLISNNGALHVASNLLFLGAEPGDSETDGQPSTLANSDDVLAVADEDGVSVFGTLNDLDRSYSVDAVATNQTGDLARLIAWIDFDGNGTFDADEAAIRNIPTGATNSTVTLTWSSIPLDIQAGNSYVRLRITSESINNREPAGAKGDGEIEDYPITISSAGVTVSGRVYIDANSSGTPSANELGIGSTVVVLHDTVLDICRSSQTSASGDYKFVGVLPASYEIYQAHGETVPVPQSCGSGSLNNPIGYQSTTIDILNPVVGLVDVPNQDFGEVAGVGAGLVFEPDHQGEVLPIRI